MKVEYSNFPYFYSLVFNQSSSSYASFVTEKISILFAKSRMRNRLVNSWLCQYKNLKSTDRKNYHLILMNYTLTFKIPPDLSGKHNENLPLNMEIKD